MLMVLVIHTDGGSRGNPGPAASAFTVQNSNNEILHEEKKYLGITTNNVAEYTALLMAWDWLSSERRLDVSEVSFLLDSELVVKQMRGEYKIKDSNLLLLAARVKEHEKNFLCKASYIHIPRKENSRADELVNLALDAEFAQGTSTGKE